MEKLNILRVVQGNLHYEFAGPNRLWLALHTPKTFLVSGGGFAIPENSNRDRLATLGDAALRLALTEFWYLSELSKCKSYSGVSVV